MANGHHITNYVQFLVLKSSCSEVLLEFLCLNPLTVCRIVSELLDPEKDEHLNDRQTNKNKMSSLVLK